MMVQRLGSRMVTSLASALLLVFLCASAANAQIIFAPPVKYDIGTPPRSFAAADFNTDGHSDLAVGTVNGVSILMNKGDGTFALPVRYAFEGWSGGLGTSVLAADYNSDGHPDLAVSLGGPIAVMMNKGNGTFASPAFYYPSEPMGGSWTAGDFDGDGNMDLAGYGAFFGQNPSIDIFLNSGDGTFLRFGRIRGERGGLTAADVNNDGRSDLIVANRGFGPSGEFDKFLNIVNQVAVPSICACRGGSKTR